LAKSTEEIKAVEVKEVNENEVIIEKELVSEEKIIDKKSISTTAAIASSDMDMQEEKEIDEVAEITIDTEEPMDEEISEDNIEEELELDQENIADEDLEVELDQENEFKEAEEDIMETKNLEEKESINEEAVFDENQEETFDAEVDSSEDDIFGSFDSEGSEEMTGFDDDDAGFAGMSEIISELKIAGKLELPLRYMPQDKNVSKSKTDFSPVFDLKVNYQKNNSETNVNIEFDEDSNEAKITEGTFKLFYKKIDVEIGKAKVVWGKGDKLHVIDTINANDYSDFINPEYIDRRIAEPMIRINYFKENSNIEFIYTPQFTPDQVPMTGPWANPTFAQLNDAFNGLGKDLEKELNKNDKAEDGQFGIRYRNSIKGYDYGFTYYAGFIKKPSLNMAAVAKLQATSEKAANLEADQLAMFQLDAQITATEEGIKQTLIANGLTPGDATYEAAYEDQYNQNVQPLQTQLMTLASEVDVTLSDIKSNPNTYYDPTQDNWEDKVVEELDLHYDPVHILGANLATIKMGINWRAELGYYITEDSDGDKYDTYNNKFGYVLGGDKNIPINNLNLNIQIQGEKILNSDEIKDNGELDIEYDKDGDYSSNLIVTKITDQYYNNKINPEITYIYNVEKNDYSIESGIEFIVKDDTKIKAKYKIFEGDPGTNFGNYKKNDYFECTFKYEF